MSVRAKFVLMSYTTHLVYPGGKESRKELRALKFSPVTNGSEENKSFFAYTPSGSVELGTVNEEAWKQFELGKSYYLDFTPAE
jgi:hypothetical protein